MNQVYANQLTLSYQDQIVLEANADGSTHDFQLGNKLDLYREGFLEYRNGNVTNMFITCSLRRNGDIIMAFNNKIRDHSAKCTRREIILYHKGEIIVLNKDLFNWIKNTEYLVLVERGVIPKNYKCRTVETTIGIKTKSGDFEFSYDIETGECFSTEPVLITDSLVLTL